VARDGNRKYTILEIITPVSDRLGALQVNHFTRGLPKKKAESTRTSGEAGDWAESGGGTGPIPEQHGVTCEANISRKIGQKSMAVRYCIPLGVFGCAFLFLIITMYRRFGAKPRKNFVDDHSHVAARVCARTKQSPSQYGPRHAR